MRESGNANIQIESMGSRVQFYTLKNQTGIQVTLTNYGAAVYRILTPDRDGRVDDIALSSPSPETFMDNKAFFGATVGRVANRIKQGRITVGCKEYQLSLNEGKNHAHGGFSGFDKKIWNGKIRNNAVEFTYTSPDKEEGYPGSVTVTVSYRLDGEGRLHIRHHVESTEDTIINLTNHTYFNLGGHASGKIYDQRLQINGGFYLESDAELIPTGQILRVGGTPFDFTQEKELGLDIHSEIPMLTNNGGYDVTFLKAERGFTRAAVLKDKKSGRCLEVFTDYPAIHLYTGNFLKDEPGLENRVYNRHESVCLEAQRLPFASGYAHFGEIGLKAGEQMERNICYHFSAER